MIKPLLLLLLALSVTLIAKGQNNDESNFNSYNNRGKVFLSWGGNRVNYSNSDIHFKGENYDFELKNVKAVDKPKGFHIDYINPTRMTIPQTNFALGYFISDKYAIVLKVDHMKYVMMSNQKTRVSGNISLLNDEIGSQYNGVYNDEIFFITEDFLSFEHTDGLNYINFGVSRFDRINHFLGLTSKSVSITLTEGVEIGVLYPKSNVKLFDNNKNDEFNIAGYGASLHSGIRVEFLKYFFVQGNLKAGYINMNNINTTQNNADRASQRFFFFEKILELGTLFKL